MVYFVSTLKHCTATWAQIASYLLKAATKKKIANSKQCELSSFDYKYRVNIF